MKLKNYVLMIVCLGLVAVAATAPCFSIEDRLSQVETKLEGVRKENAFLKTEIGDLKHEDGISKQKIAQLVQENKSTRAELDDVKKERQVDREEIQKLNSQVESLREELGGAVSDIDDLKTKIQELESCGCGGGSPPATVITSSSPTSLTDMSTSSTEMTTWLINAETEFIDVGFTEGRIGIFKDLSILVVGRTVNKIYDLRTRQLVRTFGEGTPAVFKQNQLIIASPNGPINIWNVETGELVNRLVGNYKGWIWSIALNKNQSLMLTGGIEDNIVRLWDMTELRQVRTFTGHESTVFSVVLDEARSQVMSGSNDQTIRVWNINDGSLIRIINGHSYWISKLLLDEETGRLFSASYDRTIKEWDLESGKELRTFTGHTTYVIDLIFSEDGRRLISSSDDNSVIIWDKESGQQIKRLNHTETVIYLALNPLNGQLLSTQSYCNDLIFWPVKP